MSKPATNVRSAQAAEDYPWAQSILRSVRERVAQDSLPNAIVLTAAPGWGLEYIAERAE